MCHVLLFMHTSLGRLFVASAFVHYEYEGTGVCFNSGPALIIFYLDGDSSEAES